MSETEGNRSYSQELHNYIGKHQLGQLEWEDSHQRIDNNGNLWAAIAQINGTTYGKGHGATKAEARAMAAERALEALEAL